MKMRRKSLLSSTFMENRLQWKKGQKYNIIEYESWVFNKQVVLDAFNMAINSILLWTIVTYMSQDAHDHVLSLAFSFPFKIILTDIVLFFKVTFKPSTLYVSFHWLGMSFGYVPDRPGASIAVKFSWVVSFLDSLKCSM